MTRHINMDKKLHKICVMALEDSSDTRGDDGKQHHSTYIGAAYKQGDSVEKILTTCFENIGMIETEDSFRKEILRLVFNLILYINSPDPAIMMLKPQTYNTRNFRENYMKKAKNERDMFGIYSLGWDFHGREYTVEMGFRKGHWKWQPCGKQWCDRKLIFVQATTVKYKNVRSDKEVTDVRQDQ